MLPDALQTKEPMFPIKRPTFRHIPPQNVLIADDRCRLHPIAADSPDNAPDKGPDPPDITPDYPDSSRIYPFLKPTIQMLPYFKQIKFIVCRIFAAISPDSSQTMP